MISLPVSGTGVLAVSTWDCRALVPLSPEAVITGNQSLQPAIRRRERHLRREGGTAESACDHVSSDAVTASIVALLPVVARALLTARNRRYVPRCRPSTVLFGTTADGRFIYFSD